MDEVRDTTQNKTISLYTSEWAAVSEIGKELGLATVTATIRFVLRDWLRERATVQSVPSAGGERE